MSPTHPSRWLLTGPDKYLSLGKNNTTSHWDLIITQTHCHTGSDVWPQIAISHPLSCCTLTITHRLKHLHLTQGLKEHKHIKSIIDLPSASFANPRCNRTESWGFWFTQHCWTRSEKKCSTCVKWCHNSIGVNVPFNKNFGEIRNITHTLHDTAMLVCYFLLSPNMLLGDAIHSTTCSECLFQQPTVKEEPLLITTSIKHLFFLMKSVWLTFTMKKLYINLYVFFL